MIVSPPADLTFVVPVDEALALYQKKDDPVFLATLREQYPTRRVILVKHRAFYGSDHFHTAFLIPLRDEP